jgi:hypothetical protein
LRACSGNKALYLIGPVWRTSETSSSLQPTRQVDGVVKAVLSGRSQGGLDFSEFNAEVPPESRAAAVKASWNFVRRQFAALYQRVG